MDREYKIIWMAISLMILYLSFDYITYFLITIKDKIEKRKNENK